MAELCAEARWARISLITASMMMATAMLTIISCLCFIGFTEVWFRLLDFKLGHYSNFEPLIFLTNRKIEIQKSKISSSFLHRWKKRHFIAFLQNIISIEIL